eukprot:3201419-Prorocentrum_lima.AAC.1
MTSSLVGSEMCIRDRFVDVGSQPCGPAPSPPYLAPSEPLDLPTAGTCPVSYTHLTLPTICSV